MHLGHAHLKVRNLDRALAFYRDLIGLKITERLGDDFVFLTFGKAHHDIALQALGNAAPDPAPRAIGLYHVAFEVETEAELETLAAALRHAGLPAHGVDHGISHALYTHDPDGHGIEFYRDTRAGSARPLWSGTSASLNL